MPITRRDYLAVPAAIPRRTADARTIGELLGRQGDISAQQHAMRGQTGANLWAGLAQAVAGFQAHRAAEAMKAEQLEERRAIEAARIEERRTEQAAMEQFRRDQLAQQAAQHEATRDAQRLARTERLAETTQPGVITSEMADALRPSGRVQVLDGVPVLMRTPAQLRQAFLDKQAEAKAKTDAANVEADNARADSAEKARREHELRMQQIAAGKSAPVRQPVWVVDPNGEFRDLAGVAPPGSKPANAREQGRPVTSGDAGRIADVDEALKLAAGLDFKPSDTGILPALGAALPDAVTNLTGFGVDAKQRQGVVNLVKQIIGKGLEGGVLRKEDETKYSKMLPTMSDHPDVVQTKIKNLSSTLDQKRSTLLDALSDAGYDTSRFLERGMPKTDIQAVPDLSGLKPGTGRRFREGPFAGQTWKIGPDGSPQRVP